MPMASITIRNLDDELKKWLRLRAAEHGRSMDEEARQILKDALSDRYRRGTDLVRAIREIVEPIGGIDIELPPREPIRDPPDFSRPGSPEPEELLREETPKMASITIRNLDDELKKRLRLRAAERGRSMEEEARDILRETLSKQSTGPEQTGLDLFNEIRALFEPLGGMELEIPPREPGREPPRFGEIDENQNRRGFGEDKQ
jgi:antitoxin FitA